MNKEDMLYQATLMKNQSEEIENQMKNIDSILVELNGLLVSIELIKNNNKEFLSQLGHGVYVKSEAKEKEFYINVGSGVVTKKSPENAKKMIETQVQSMKKTKIQLSAQLDQYAHEFKKMLKELETL